jgi:hypothetical protein
VTRQRPIQALAMAAPQTLREQLAQPLLRERRLRLTPAPPAARPRARPRHRQHSPKLRPKRSRRAHLSLRFERDTRNTRLLYRSADPNNWDRQR